MMFFLPYDSSWVDGKHGSGYFSRKSVTPRSWIWFIVLWAGWLWSGKSSHPQRTTRNAWGTIIASPPCSATPRKATSRCCRSVCSCPPGHPQNRSLTHTLGLLLEAQWKLLGSSWVLLPTNFNYKNTVICRRWSQLTGQCLSITSGNYSCCQQAELVSSWGAPGI